MWLCSQCGFKNNNSSKRCHGKDCMIERGKMPQKEAKKVIDFCPKCNKETIFTFERKKMVEREESTLEGGRRVKTVVEKRFRCSECNSLCRQVGKSKKIPEVIENAS